MELLYFWIEDFRNIKQQNILLSSKFKIAFNPKESYLQIDDNNEYIANFFGKQITNITAIVGQNGTGKTSILDFIKDKLAISNEYLRHKLIFVIRKENSKGFENIVYINNINENNFHIINNSQDKFELKEYKQYADQSKSTRLINKKLYGNNENNLLKPSIFEALPDFESTRFIFYSNIFDYREENSSSLLYNCSTNYL